MSGEDVIVSIGIDASAANEGLARSSVKFSGWSRDTEKALAKAEAASKKLDKSIAALDKPIDHAAASAAKLRAESEKLEKVASLLGPRMGGLVSMMSKFGKASGSDIGGATLALAGLAAGAGAALYALGSFGSMVLDTIDNVDDLAASLDVVTRKRLAEQITSLRNARDALDDASDSWTELKIVASATADGPLADTATWLGSIAEGWALVGEAANKFYDDHQLLARMLGFNSILHDGAELLRKVDQYYENAATPRGGSVAPGTGPLMPQKPVGVGDLTFDFAGSVAQPATASNRPKSAADVTADSIMSSMFLPGITIPKSQIDLHAAGLAAVADLDAKFAEEKAARDKAMADEAIAQIEREKAARLEATQAAIVIGGQLVSALAAFSDAEAQAKVDGAKKGTLAYYYAVQDQFNAAQEFALGMAAMNIALGFTQELATKGVIGVATGAVLAASGAIEVATILAQKPPEMRHTGGPMMAGDEYVIRAGEVPAMLTAEGAKNRQGLADLNAGVNTKSAEPVIYLVNESGMQRARQHTKPRPDLGLRMAGVR